MANYPGNTVGFVNKVDLTSTVIASDVNSLYDEVTAIAAELGLNPSQRTSGTWSTSWTSSGNTKFTNVKLRLDNAENGAYTANDALVSRYGGTTVISTGATSAVSLSIKQASSQTGNLLEFRTSADTVVSYARADGTFFTPVLDGGGA